MRKYFSRKRTSYFAYFYFGSGRIAYWRDGIPFGAQLGIAQYKWDVPVCCAFPFVKKIAFYLASTKRKRKHSFYAKNYSIAHVQRKKNVDRLETTTFSIIAILLNPPVFQCTTNLDFPQAAIAKEQDVAKVNSPNKLLPAKNLKLGKLLKMCYLSDKGLNNLRNPMV